MSALGLTHLVFALTALLAGTTVIVTRKGTRYHRTLGHVYFTSVVGVNVTALLIYRLTGAFNFFHMSALFSLSFLLLGMASVIARWPRHQWLELHANFITGSYVGVVAATAAEIATRLPSANFGLAAGAATTVIVFAGLYLIATRMPAVLDQLRPSRRPVENDSGLSNR